MLDVIGGGGMGLVYTAEDLKLGRQVALKFLPEELATDSLALQRFDREARTASSLSHRNICTIHEFGEHAGQPFIVMELLEGETLRELLAKAAVAQTARLALEKLIEIAVQVADGLDAAHQKGVIHRDVKPANIFVATGGQVKILDFGLAKLAAAASEGPTEKLPDDHAPDIKPQPRRETGIEHSLTRLGTAMGTAGYMSPEQVRGEKLDARTDLFSFGLVLYEMTTGQRAFSGETATVVQDAILNQPAVPVRQLNSSLSFKLEQIVGRALEKDREKRYQSAAEMRADLELVRDGSRPAKGALWKWFVAPGVFIALALGGVLYWHSRNTFRLTASDTVVFADLSNLTGDRIFDDVLNTALRVELEQTPSPRHSTAFA